MLLQSDEHSLLPLWERPYVERKSLSAIVSSLQYLGDRLAVQRFKVVEAFIPKWHTNFALKALIPPIEDAFEDVSRLGEVGIRESSPKQKVRGALFKLLRSKRSCICAGRS